MIQRGWLVLNNLALTTLLGYNVGLGTVGVLEDKLDSSILSSPVSTKAVVHPEKKEYQTFSSQVVESILEANAFNARRNPKPLPEILPADGVPVAAKLSIRLAGTALLGTISFAIITDQSNEKQRAYQLNDCLPTTTKKTECISSQGRLVKINPRSVEVKYNGKIQVYDIQHREVASNTESRSLASARSSTRSRISAPLPVTRRGRKIDVNVPSVEVQQAFENFSSVLKQALVVPHEENGKPDGFSIKKIVPGGVFARLNLKNGDVIQTVNGSDLTTADQAIQLLNAFRNDKEIVLGVKRNGKPLEFNYHVK